jgi:hypothetical protein
MGDALVWTVTSRMTYLSLAVVEAVSSPGLPVNGEAILDLKLE